MFGDAISTKSEFLTIGVNTSDSEDAKKSKEREKYTNYLKATAFLSTAKKVEKYYYLDEEALDDIGITNSSYKYIVCYSTGEVMNADVIKTASGKVLYMSNDFRAYE